MAKIIHCTFVLSTPAFIGDGNQQVADTLRPPSIKGALRFWWRALQWSAVRKQHATDEQALAALHSEEAALFGSTQQKSRVSLKIKGTFAQWQSSQANSMDGVKYLAGQGVFDFKKGFERGALVSTTPFELTLILDNLVTSEQEAQLCRALSVFGHLGAIGSRARKGFGSVSIQSSSVPQVQVASTIEELNTITRSIANSTTQGLPPFTAISAATRIDVTRSNSSTGLQALDHYGKEMVRYRSYGRNGKILGSEKAKQNFKDDHDLVIANNQKRDITQAPRRIVFGLPSNYFFSSSRLKVQIDPAEHNRRASPLFCHIHQFASGERAQVLALIPAEFLPEREGLNFKYDRANARLDSRHLKPDWSVISEFMDRFDKGVEKS